MEESEKDRKKRKEEKEKNKKKRAETGNEDDGIGIVESTVHGCLSPYCSQSYYARHSTPFIRLCVHRRAKIRICSAKYRSRIFVFNHRRRWPRLELLGRSARLWKARLIPGTRWPLCWRHARVPVDKESSLSSRNEETPLPPIALLAGITLLST